VFLGSGLSSVIRQHPEPRILSVRNGAAPDPWSSERRSTWPRSTPGARLRTSVPMSTPWAASSSGCSLAGPRTKVPPRWTSSSCTHRRRPLRPAAPTVRCRAACKPFWERRWPRSRLDLRRAIRSALTRAAALRQLRASEEAATRSQQALFDVERRYPGIGSAELVDGAYVVSPERVTELAARLQGSLLEVLIER